MLPVVLAHAAGSNDGSGGLDPRAIALGLAIAAVAVLAGPLLTWPRSSELGPVSRKRAALGHVAGLGAAALATAAGLTRPAAVVAIGCAVLAAFAPVRSRGAVAPSVVVLVLVTGGGPGRFEAFDRLLGVTHVVAAALWIAVVLEVAIAWWSGAGAGRRAARQAARPALVLVVVVAATGSINAAEHLGDARLALGTWWGRLLAVKIVVVAMAAGAGALLRRAWTPQTETMALGGAAVVGLVLAAAGSPLSGAAPTGPLFVAVDGATVVVTPMAPGANAVLVSGAVDVLVDGEPVGDEVDLRAGRHVISVGDARFPVTIREPEGDVITASMATDDPDCLDRLAGAAAAAAARTAAGRPTRLEVRSGGAVCGVDGASAADGPSPVVAALDALVARGNSAAPTVVVDGSERAAALAAEVPGAVVVDSAAVDGAGPGPVVVATDRTVAADVARRIAAASSGTVPVILAPWLLDADLLGALAGDGVPVLVAAERDPTSALAVDYRIAATAQPNGFTPTAAGLQGYLDALGIVADPNPGLFGLSRVAILPPSIDAHPSEAGWAPGVALVRVA